MVVGLCDCEDPDAFPQFFHEAGLLLYALPGKSSEIVLLLQT